MLVSYLLTAIFLFWTECPPSAPLNIFVDVIHFKGTNFTANISWDPATFFGTIDRYVVYVSRRGEALSTNDSDRDILSDSSFRIVSVIAPTVKCTLHLYCVAGMICRKIYSVCKFCDLQCIHYCACFGVIVNSISRFAVFSVQVL